MLDRFLHREVNILPRYAAIFFAGLIILFFASRRLHSGRIKDLQAELENVQAQTIAAEQHIDELKRQLAFRGTDEYIARVAKEKFGYIREGEIRFVMEGMAVEEYLAPVSPVTFVSAPPQPAETPMPQVTPEIIIDN